MFTISLYTLLNIAQIERLLERECTVLRARSLASDTGADAVSRLSLSADSVGQFVAGLNVRLLL